MNVAFNVRFATRLGERLVGLLRNDVCASGEVLVLSPCSNIHTFGMKGDIDVAFVDACGCVLKTERSLQPRRFCSCDGARVVLERRSTGDSPWFEVGDVVGLTGVSAS